MSRHKNILVIDDDTDLLQGLGIRLVSEGYRVTVASNIPSALTAVRNNPDLVLLDLGLPDGDGMRLLANLKGLQTTSEIPVIVISARDVVWEKDVLAAGALAFFQKPVANDELMAAIALVLEGADAPISS
jgi:two-component system KDP operon response regulator KdpE